MYRPPPPPLDRDVIVPLVLATQPGDGFGRATRWLADWGGVPLIDARLREIAAWELAAGVVVLGDAAEDVVEHAELAGFDILIDPEWAEGEASSVRAGLDFVQRRSDIETVVLASADQTTVPAQIVTTLLEERRSAQKPAAIPKYRYVSGRPIVIHRELWPRLLGLEGASGVEAVLATHARWVTEVWFDRLPPRSITSPEDLSELAPRR